MAFAKQKLAEVATLATAAAQGKQAVASAFAVSDEAAVRRTTSGRISLWGGGEADVGRRGGSRSQKHIRSAAQEATVLAATAAVSDDNDRLVPPD